MPRITTPATADVAPATIRPIDVDSRPASPLCGEPVEGSTDLCGRYAGHSKGTHKPSMRASLRVGAVE